MLQLPRDTYANYTEKNYRKLNGAVAELGYKLAEAGKTVPCEDIAPAYLRVSQAEREYAEKHKQSQ